MFALLLKKAKTRSSSVYNKTFLINSVKGIEYDCEYKYRYIATEKGLLLS